MRNRMHTRGPWLVLAGILVGLTLLGPAVAPVLAGSTPGQIRVQGVLRDADGDPVTTASVTVTVKYYDAVTGGTTLATETLSSQSITDGKYNFALGSGSFSSGNPAYTSLAAILEAEAEVWFTLDIGGDGESSPRAKLHCSPYCLNAEVVGGKEYSELLTTTSTTETKSGGLTLDFVVFAEQSSNPYTTTAGNGLFWLTDEPKGQALVFEDDAGTETPLAGRVAPGNIPISSGVATLPADLPQGALVTVSAESGTTDTLDSLSGGRTGQVIVLRAHVQLLIGAHTITLTDDPTALILPGSTNATLVGDDRIWLRYDGSVWVTLSYSDN